MAGSLSGFFFDVEAWFASTPARRMSYAEKGVYLEMMFQEWRDRQKSLPDDPNAVADLLVIRDSQRAEIVAAWPTVRDRFVTDRRVPGRIYNVRVEQTRRQQAKSRHKKSEAGKAGGKAKAAKRLRAEDLAASIASLVPEVPLALSSDKKRLEEKGLDQISSEEREKNPPVSLSPAAPLPADPARDPFTDPDVTERAGRFIERYAALYPQHRNGAKYAVKPGRDYQAAVELCTTWDDDARLDKLAVCFLTTDHKFAAEGSRTIPQFRALASWCDGELSTWEAKRKRA